MKMSFFAFLLLAIILLLPTHAVYYVKEGNPSSSPDGTLEDPFDNLIQAVTTLGTGSFELVLLGNDITLTSLLSIPPQSNYIIRANDNFPGYFPVRLKEGAGISTIQTSLTLQSIQIIELNPDRSNKNPALDLYSGYLTLRRVLVADISYPQSYYIFLSAISDTEESKLTITECSFQNLTNVQLAISSTEATISDTKISGISQNTGFFLSFDDYNNLIMGSDVRLTNITFENSILENYDKNEEMAFIGFYMTTNNIFIEGLTLKNISLASGTYFLQTLNGIEDTNSPTSFNLMNIKIKDVFEIDGSSKAGRIFDFYGATHFVVSNLYASNVRMKTGALLSYVPNVPKGSSSKNPLLPSVNVDDVRIEDSTNANLLLSNLDTVNIKNVELKNTRFDPSTDSVLFSLNVITKLNVRNIYSTTHYGPMFSIIQSSIQGFENCTFENATISQFLPTSLQLFFALYRYAGDAKTFSEDNLVTVFKNFNINGFTDTDGLDISGNSNDTYFIMINSEYINVIIRVIVQDSKWSNVQMGALLSQSMSSLKIDGLTIDVDPFINQKDVPWHRLCQFMNLGKIEVKNSKFLNNKNADIFNFYNIRRSQIYDNIEISTLIFDNISVLNNDLVSEGTNVRYSSFFMITSPLKPIKLTISNSKFADNKLANGVILVTESRQVDISLIDNHFESNSAQDSGTVLTARDMQDEYSSIEIRGNRFINNMCLKNGGVFAFISSKLKIEASGNNYMNNSAGTTGGVGYVLKTKSFYSETNSQYSNNYAGVSGGSWYFDVGLFERRSIIPLVFSNTSFIQSTANQKGGALYIATGSLNLNNCIFTSNKAGVFGGDIYLVAFSSVHVKGTTFTKSSAPVGSLLYAETLLQQTILIEDSMISSISSSSPNSVLFKSNSGSFKISNTQIYQISSSLFQLDGTVVELDRVSLKNIDCSETKSSCILQGQYLSFKFTDSQIVNVKSGNDLVMLGSPSEDVVLMNNIHVSNVRQSTEMMYQNKQLFIFKAASAEKVQIMNSSFENLLDFCSIYAKKSYLQISNTIFSRVGQQQIKSSNSRKTQFLLLDSSDVLIENSSFLKCASDKNGANGGAIQITGNEGKYKISGCKFDGNQAYRGGAISVEGKVDGFEVEKSTFTNNVATAEGGSIYFAGEGKGKEPMINTCTFESNQASKGGAIFVSNPKVMIKNSVFKKNSAAEGAAIYSSNKGGKSMVDLENNTFIANNVKVSNNNKTIRLLLQR